MNRKNICEICTLIMGQSPDSKSYNKDKNGIPFYQGNADFGEKHPTPTVWCTAPKKIARKGDILISVRAPIGDMNIANEDCCIGRGLAAIRLNKSDIVDINYLYHYLSATVEFLQEQGTGSTFKAINKTTLEGIEIPCPSIEKQKNIAKFIIEIKTSIQYKKAELVALNELVKSRFIEMFGDPQNNNKQFPTKKLIDVVTLQRGHDLPVQNRDSHGSVPVYGSNGVLGFHTIAKCDRGIITGRSGTIGEVYVSEEPFWPLNTTLYSNNTHGNNLIYLKYLLMFFNLKRFKSGAGVPTLNRNEFHGKEIMDVPIELQNDFADFVKLIDKSKFIVQKQIDDLQELLDSKMDEYFG